MKDVIFKNRWVQIVYGALLMVAGILTTVFAVLNTANLNSAISIIVAVCLFILGIVYIASSFASETKVLFPASLLFGSFAVAAGVLLCVNSQLLGGIIVYLVGALMIAYGVVCGVKGITFVLIKAKMIYRIMFFVIAVVLITLGVLTYVYNANASVVIYAGTGGILAIYGVVQIVIAVKKMIKANKKEEKVVAEQKPAKEIEQKEEPKVIDAEVKEIEEK